ncbi:hypothetical protein [Acetivibrio clariflavus]|uniref:hypothetical protein n=1 Tax=Acetivibrio clariflavus TaxID=288965 RepID=UPI00048104A8|nr:hypothetical protein [Acetivibrio clariflavus]NLM11336.1 hypothetical protein [Clostridiaceae bacterium]
MKEFINLKDDEIIRLLRLRHGLNYGTVGKIDEDIISLEEKGYIKQNGGTSYDFTLEGKKLIDEFWSKYSEATKEVVKEYGATFSTYERLVKETGLSWRVIYEILDELRIEIKP